MNDGRKIYTVSELNREIKAVCEATWPDIWMEGEVSNFRAYPSGHWYFSLKDAEGQIASVMFAGVNRAVPFVFEDGMQLLVRGRVSSYPKRGDCQFIVLRAEPAGKGALQLAFEQLKAKLEKEGLFAPERKRPLPLLPRRIGVVTSIAGAALRDILAVLDRRFSTVGVLVHPVRVQGEGAAAEIAGAIAYLNRHYPALDVLLVGRGGGSLEDLWAFNEERVARAIAASRIPVVSCVGHETDVTIADLVADLRAPTPSAAAEQVVRTKAELSERVALLARRLAREAQAVLDARSLRVRAAAGSRFLRDPLAFFEARAVEIDSFRERLSARMRTVLDRSVHGVEMRAAQLQALSPLRTLERGYAVCRAADGGVVTDAGALAPGDAVDVRVARGSFTARVGSVR